ncbi:MAG: formylglycine-generating enzyme family protein [Verrucomicrobiae bacterium]|nr:formylglycine-generating enzyme family protein [Verrucomicrobiae bacterium]
MNSPKIWLWLMLLALAVTSSAAQEMRFFRVAGPVAVTITGISAEGFVTWTNVPTNATFTVQTATDLAAGNWMDWVEVPVSSATTIHQIFDPNPLAGMVFIPAGSFTMGSNLDPISVEQPSHTVYVSAFYMDQYEVTKAKWDEVYQWATNHGYSFDYANSGQGKAANHPAHSMTWYDTVKWCNARSEKEGRTPAYYTSAAQTTVYRTGQVSVQNDWVKWDANGYRLPTEAEWEKAARGGVSGQRFPWGNTISHSQANYRSSWEGGAPYYPYDVNPTSGYHPAYNADDLPYTSPVGSFAPNGYGLYDMAGNMWEWCWDGYASGYYSNSPSSDPRGHASSSARVVRGGSWGVNAFGCRTAGRDGYYPTIRGFDGGLRCVRSAGQ